MSSKAKKDMGLECGLRWAPAPPPLYLFFEMPQQQEFRSSLFMLRRGDAFTGFTC